MVRLSVNEERRRVDQGTLGLSKLENREQLMKSTDYEFKPLKPRTRINYKKYVLQFLR